MWFIQYLVELLKTSFPVSFLLACCLYGIVYAYKKYKGDLTFKKWSTFIFIFYLIWLLYVTIYRDGLFTNTMHRVNVVPFEVLFTTFQNMYNTNQLNAFLFLLYNVIGNILWFIPLGYFLGKHYDNMNVYKILIASISLSFGIEVVQYVAYVGVSDVDDLICNVMGGLIGYLIYIALRKRGEHLEH